MDMGARQRSGGQRGQESKGVKKTKGRETERIRETKLPVSFFIR